MLIPAGVLCQENHWKYHGGDPRSLVALNSKVNVVRMYKIGNTGREWRIESRPFEAMVRILGFLGLRYGYGVLET